MTSHKSIITIQPPCCSRAWCRTLRS